MDRRLLNKHIASMLAVILVLTNSNITLPAEEVSSETESIFIETTQETVLDTSQQIQIEETPENIGEEVPAEEQPAEASEATVANQTVESPEALTEEQPTTGKENAGEEQPEKQTEMSISEKEQSEEQTETLTGETLEETSEEGSEEESESLDLRSDNGNKWTIRTVQDLVNLSKEEPQKYQNAEITLAPHDINELDLSGKDFKGLGSDAYPFKGSISFSGNYTGYITLDKSLFNAVYSDAKISSTLNLKAANNMPDPILAKSYVKGKETETANEPIKLNIDAKSTDITEGGGQTSYSSFGGIIGTLGEGASVSLSITSVIPQAKAAVSGEGNRGFFCNTMMKNASLIVSAFSGSADFQVISTNENAGALVGAMDTGAQLTVIPEFTFSGSVSGAVNAGGIVGNSADGAKIAVQNNYTVNGSISSGNGSAGGLIGAAVNNPVTVTNGKNISVSSASLSAGANSAAGGLFGECTVSGNAAGLDLTSYTINGVSITSGKYAGGVFGMLKNQAGNYTVKIQDEADKTISSTGQGADNYGGLIGNYQADQLTSGLELTGLSIVSSHTGEEKTAYSGVIAEVTGKSYVKVENLTVSVDQQVANGNYFGGLVANCSGDSASGFFDIGTVKISGTNNTVKAEGASGGLIGKLEDGVVRLSGKTDLSGIQPGGEGSQYGQLVGNRGAALIYALGTGSDFNAGTAAGWTLVRDGSGKSVSDIGSWGEVIRMDGKKLKEDSSDLLAYDRVNHTVTVKKFELSNISTEQDFAAIALTMQCSGAKADGALRFSSGAAFNSQITLTGDSNTSIDLTGTGVTGLMRDDETQGVFTGSLNGGNRTVVLSIGDAYGVKADGTTCALTYEGCGQIYNHSYLGLFAKTGSLTGAISDITVSGNINYGLSTQKEIWVGGVTAFQEAGTASYQNVTSDIAISFTGKVTDETKETLKAAHVGGFVGATSGAPELTFTGCKWTESITDSASKASDCYLGGYIGSMSPDGGSIALANSSIGNGADKKATITVTQPGTVSKTGGILAAVETKEGINKNIKITANGFTVNGFDTSSAATESTGGFLGYDWHNVDFTVSNLSVSNATLTAQNAGFGGLVYEAGGHWIVKEPDESQSAGQSAEKYGIKYGTGVSFNGKSADDTPSALLVCRGDDYRSTEDKEDNYALYLQINSKEAYKVDSSVSVTLNSGNYFDELVGISMGKHGNGVVSIATEKHEKLNQNTCNTYQKQLGKDYDNPHTRYYYNLNQYKKAEGDIESGDELIMWTLGQNAEWNIKDYFRVEDKDTYTKVRTVTGKIDLAGLSYYPIDYVGKINITDATITFDYEQINSCEKNNKELNNSNKQHYMMQTGLFRNLTSQKDYAAQITVTNSKLSGSIGQTADGVSGALVVGTMQGQVTENKLYPATVRIEGLILDGIYVDGVENDDYAPLLVNAADRNTTLNIKNVTTSDAYQKNNRTSAATSLFGNIGNDNAINMSVSFQNMKLDARTDSGKSDVVLYNTKQSIFTKATFLHSFQYDPKDTASSGSYTFTKDDTVKQSGNSWTGNVTYGLEISNTESGRNPGKQYYYLGNISNPEYVLDGILNTTSENSTDKTCFANGNYLRYVATAENSGGNAYCHELDINLQSADILEGCGTYDDPFQITSGAQLATVATFIVSGNSTGWKVNLPQNVINKKASLSTHDSTSEAGHYEYTSGEIWKAAEDTTGLQKEDVRAYMRNAYYQIQNDIDLPNSFYGLGGPNPDTNTFSGVIIGKKAEDGFCPKIYITAQGTTKTFGGLIAFSQGSVVKDLILEFGGRTANDSENGAAGQTTGVSESCNPMGITIEAQAASQERDKQSFFGGVIGYIVGGDNIIDNVELSGLATDKINVNKGNGNVNLVDIGGYVGLIGGNLESGGGVIFRNITGTGLSEYGTDTAEDFYYRNPFVGRVLDGYACSEGTKLENTDKNYSIPQLTENDKLTVTSSDISIGSGQQLWVLSAIVNSGAGGKKSDTYNNDAYKYGRSRTGIYASVGSKVTNNSDEDRDNTYWGGMETKLGGQVSYLTAKYTSDSEVAKVSEAAKVSETAHKVYFTADCDMSSYGNGFRGIGTSYQDNGDAIHDIKNRTLKIKTTVGDTGTENRTITLARKVQEYTSEEKTGWWTQGIGLFPVINIADTTTVQYLTISGKACISYKEDRAGKSDYIGEASAGGFAGLTANGSGANNVIFKNVKSENLTVTGAKYSGGFFGVVGQSSRTTTEKLNTISTTVGNYTFTDSSYTNITVKGGYSAGGFVGTYRNATNKKLTINTSAGNSILEDSEIGWVKDACREIYETNSQKPTEKDAKDAAKAGGYSGGGGIVGYYYGDDMTVENVTVQSLRIYGPRFAFNCDYGLGGVVGSYACAYPYADAKGKLNVKNVTIEDTVVEVDLSMQYSSPYENLPDYYLTPTCGLVAGYSLSITTANKITVNRCAVLNAGCGGGIIGNNQKKSSTLTDTTISNLDVYSQGAASYSGSPRIGGVIGSSVKDITVTNLTMTNVNVISDGVTGLVLGQAYNNSQLKVMNFINKDCNVAVTQLEGMYFLSSDNDPNSNTPSKKKDTVAGAAGMLLGANKNAAVKPEGLLQFDEKILGYNISAENLTLGVYCEEKTNLNYTYEDNNELSGKKTYSGKFTSNGKEISDFKTVIGLNDEKTKQNISYSSVSMTDSKQYRGGYLGLIVGAKKDPTNLTTLRPIQIVGLSVKDGNYPYELNGNNDATFVTKSIQNNIIQCNGNTNKDNYVIFADYLNSSFQTNDNTVPSVVTNPVSSLTVYPSPEAGKGNTLTSDGVSDSAKSSIVSDLTDSTTQTPYQKRYNRVKYNKNNALTNVAEKFDSTSGEYKERLSTYFTASESKQSDYTGINDFDVLMIDTSKSSEITQMIHEYLSVLTNCDQTGIGSTTGTSPADKAQYTSMKAYTYRWNGAKFVKTEKENSSLIINDTDHSVSVRAGAHDNQKNQFTVLDVYYANPGNAKEGYHLFIPVVVKKILQTEFSIKMRNSSSAYGDAYTSNAAMLANYGEDFTAQLTYSYIWTADEWNANIAAGTNFLWSYDKQVKLGNAKGSLANASTRYTLVDMNRREAGVTFFTGTGVDLTSTEGKSDAILKFANLKDSSSSLSTSYSSVYLSDLLPLKAETATDGTLKKLSSEKGATIRIWNAGTSAYDYYGPKNSDDSADTKYYYTVTVGKTGSEEVKVSEVYYLTVNCQEGSGVITQNATLGLDRMTSSAPSALPSRKRSAAGNSMEQNTYTLGKFYNVNDVKIAPRGEDGTGSIKSETNDYIDLDLNAKITVPEEYKNQFDTYAKNDPVYFRFAIQMHNQSLDDTGSDQILTNAVQALSVKLGNTELSAEDYTCEVSDGVLYLLVKNKKGSDFSDTTVTAKLRLSYSGGEMDAQFPMRKGTDQTSGITFSTNAAIAYSESSLDGSTMSGSGEKSTKFYRETISSVGITYRAYDTVSKDGNVSQLGINGKEVADKGGVTITTQGTYNATDISGLNTTNENDNAYPYYLVGSLELQKKTTDSTGDTAYQPVNMSDYITSVSLNNETAQNPEAQYTFKMQLTKDQVNNLATEPIKMDFSYFVKSDKSLEKLGDCSQYANYKVILKAHLENKAETALIEDVSDYIIYTNAKFYNGIISTRDFDNK